MSSAFTSGSARREVSPATVQKMLDENTQLIQAIVDYQNQGKARECSHYQQILHRNLIYLATLADSGQSNGAVGNGTQQQQQQVQQQQQSSPTPSISNQSFQNDAMSKQMPQGMNPQDVHANAMMQQQMRPQQQQDMRMYQQQQQQQQQQIGMPPNSAFGGQIPQ